MSHYIQAVIAPVEHARRFWSLWPELKALTHNGKHILFPLEKSLIEEKLGDTSSQLDPNFELLTNALISFFKSASKNGALAYIETEYHGGQGAQSAIVFSNGAIAMAGIRAHSGSINQALKLIGVDVVTEGDEFTNVGLGMARNNDDLVRKLKSWDQ